VTRPLLILAGVAITTIAMTVVATWLRTEPDTYRKDWKRHE
jgi:hypothetical protein